MSSYYPLDSQKKASYLTPPVQVIYKSPQPTKNSPNLAPTYSQQPNSPMIFFQGCDPQSRTGAWLPFNTSRFFNPTLQGNCDPLPPKFTPYNTVAPISPPRINSL